MDRDELLKRLQEDQLQAAAAEVDVSDILGGKDLTELDAIRLTALARRIERRLPGREVDPPVTD